MNTQRERAIALVKAVIAELLECDPNKLDETTAFFNLGVTSLLSEEIRAALKEFFGELSETVMFEYPNIQRLGGHLADRFIVAVEDSRAQDITSEEAVGARTCAMPDADNIVHPQRTQSHDSSSSSGGYEIAIIGHSGRFPQADNPAELWRNLLNARDCVVEIPAERWDYQRHWSLDKRNKYSSYSRWGGFINGIEEFDPLFFQISHREAELLDPQQKLFLQCAWELMEDAGYGDPGPRPTDNVGVYVGVTWNEHSILAFQESELNQEHRGAGSVYWGIPNRVSYFLDLKGPSVAIDTACSASLVAIHDACRSILSGECEMAIAGGVNLNLHPAKYIFLSQNHFLSTDGKCRSFGAGGDGYVPGEGVAAILLKPLAKARLDGDYIYGVIRGSAINHGGKVTGYTVPNPAAQRDLVVSAMRRAGVTAEQVSYIECHGTGTELGDPIEVRGLSSAFETFTDRKQFCAIGSLKSNIGHLEAAAGVVGLIKVLQGMQHKVIPASLHSEHENDKLKLGETPFYIAKSNLDWPRDGSGRSRIAGISSFGAGGSNAHLIVEDAPASVVGNTLNAPQIVPLSAPTQAQLRRYVGVFIEFIKRLEDEPAAHCSHSIENVAYTLMHGRKHFGCRLAVVAESLASLRQSWQRFLDGTNEGGQTLLSLEPATDKPASARVENSAEWARQWVEGAVAPQPAPGRRVPLPTFPFLKERSWIASGTPLVGGSSLAGAEFSPALHPLLDANSSTLKQQKYAKTFRDAEFVLRDHLVNGIPVIPGVCHLEIATVAGALAAERAVVAIRDVWFSNVISVKGQRSVEVETTLKGDAVHFQIRDPKKQTQFSKGKIEYADLDAAAISPPDPIDIEGIAKSLSIKWTREEVYELFVKTGITQKSSFQVLTAIGFEQQQCLARLELPAHLGPQFGRYKLHPALMDGAVQTAMMYVQFLFGSKTKILPFYFGEVRQFAPLSASVVVHCRLVDRANLQFDMTMCNDAGEVLISIRNFILKEMKQGHADGETGYIDRRASVSSYYSVCWQQRDVGPPASTLNRLLVIGDNSSLIQALISQKTVESANVIQIAGDEVVTADGVERFNVRPGDVRGYQDLLRQLKESGRLADRILVCDRSARTSSELTPELLETGLDNGAKDLFAFCKALMTTAKQASIVYLCETKGGLHHPLAQANSGFFKTLTLEKPSLIGKVVHLDGEYSDSERARVVAAELHGDTETDVSYRNHQRYIRAFERAAPEKFATAENSLRQGGTYLITGGLGAIGFIVAQGLRERYQANVYLVGRSPLTTDTQAVLDREVKYQGFLIYLSCDVSKYEEVEALISKITADGVQLSGVLHAAGIIDDGFIIKKTEESFARVLDPKVKGTVNLDHATKDLNLDFFVTFSSVTSILGNYGQCDYGYGNAFEDYFAHYRRDLVLRGARRGKSLTINWPYWSDGGMRLNAKQTEMLTKTFGFIPLSSEQGVQALMDGLLSELTQFAVLPEGDIEKIHEVLGIEGHDGTVDCNEPDVIESAASALTPGKPVVDVSVKVETFLRELFSRELKIPLERIDTDTSFDQYGMDSILMIDLISVMEEQFPGLPKTLLFEHHTLRELGRYFETNYSQQFAPRQALEAPVGEWHRDALPADAPGHTPSAAMPLEAAKSWQVAEADAVCSAQPAADESDGAIAIIGLAGRYPLAENLHAFWENLKQGRDCVTEVPAERWSLAQLYQPGKAVQGKSYGKWGGFLQDVDKFDPLFFNISPQEAEQMDPHERLFLETAAATIEDAGYTPETLTTGTAGQGNPVGVFAGVMWGDYQLYGVQSDDPSRWVNPRSFYWAVANRVSYCFNFSGPSLAIDTACSSSLTAIHLAIDSIRKGECQVAIAGGVNLSLHPNKYNLLSHLQFLSSDGRCRSFGEGGNGYVPGEGVGAVLLKPLTQAVADGDHIYAVVKGSAINHGGKTAGFTVPNPNRQAQLIANALETSGVHPRTISYLEAHGTGTSLGDPIEISGLAKAFGQSERQYCAIGSLKSNVGHLEAAAGIAGLTKVLLQIKHRMLVPSLHAEEVNRNIDFAASPFHLQQRLERWNRPTFLNDDGIEVELPRIAGISSFGAGGSNAHLIIEEYLAPLAQTDDDGLPTDPAVILLSAKSADALKAYAGVLKSFCDSSEDINIQDLAYTLQVGRVHMDHRLAIRCSNQAELRSKLQSYLDGRSDAEGLSLGYRGDSAALTRLLVSDNDGKEFIERWLLRRNYSGLVSLWIDGAAIDWRGLHRGRARKRLTAPTYPFSRERYWISIPRPAGGLAVLHPLLDRNISDLYRTIFSKTLSTDDFYVRDHRLGSVNVMPAAAYMEMAVQAGAIACGRQVTALRNVVWAKPLVIREESRAVTIELFGEDAGVAFEIALQGVTDGTIYSQGIVETEAARAQGTRREIDIQALKNRLRPLSAEAVHERFSLIGLEVGPDFRVIQQLYCGEHEAFASLAVPPGTGVFAERFVLHPGLMDGVLRTCMGAGPDSDWRFMPIPVELVRLDILRHLNTDCYVHAVLSGDESEQSGVRTFDIRVIDLEGQDLLRLEGLALRLIPHVPAAKPGPPADRGSGDIESHLKQLISAALKVPLGKIESDRQLEEYGIDSTTIMALTANLEQTFGTLPKTLFFEYQDVRSLGAYFLENHADKLSRLAPASAAGHSEVTQDTTTRQGQEPAFSAEQIKAAPLRARKRFAGRRTDIAIVGIGGRYPKARNLDEYYENLRSGRNCVTEIPAARWNAATYYDPDRKRLGKSYSKWGGFLEDIDKFDPLFFSIAPADVLTIDPQERLFLETAWETIENAGYTRASLSGATVGVFVGAMWGHYELLGVREGGGISQKLPGSTFSSIANRVSYYFNFHGPSLAIDTMCSSSLTAIHLACESIKRGECDVAIAGGVNLNVHPHKYLQLSGNQFLSTDGTCRSFGEGGDGYVPGEGVGALLLKPLRMAEEDGDFIHGVIRATGVNHGGKNNGFYVPSPTAQGELIARTLSRNGIRADELTYLEAHGTGTSLGDPIEVAGLKKALSSGVGAERTGSMGSVKSNIGHLEAAAGIAAVTKVVLQLNHHELFPSLHSAKLNPNLDLEDAPFHVQQRLEKWDTGSAATPKKRMAGINAFGAGGSNAFLVVAEYEGNRIGDVDTAVPQLVPISARTGGALQQYAQRLLEFLEINVNQTRNYGRPLRLIDVAYTLQACREEMAERLAVVVDSLEALRACLKTFGDAGARAPGVYRGSAVPTSGGVRSAVAATHGDLNVLAEAWVSGAQVELSKLPRGGDPRKIPLPTYCFQRKSYWFSQVEAAKPQTPVMVTERGMALIDGVESSSGSVKVFRKRLSVDHPVVASHRFNTRALLPGVAYLEMAVQAMSAGRDERGFLFKGISWQQPLYVGEAGTDVFLSLSHQESGVTYEVWTRPDSQRVVHGKGSASRNSHPGPSQPRIDVQWLDDGSSGFIDQQAFYALFDRWGLAYSNEFRCINGVRRDGHRVLARYAIPASRSDAGRYCYEPAILDSALQAFVALPAIAEGSGMSLPFAVDEAEFITAPRDRGYVSVSVAENGRHEALIADESGFVCVRLSGVRMRAISRTPVGRPVPGAAAAIPHATAVVPDDLLAANVQRHLKGLFARFMNAEVADLKSDVSFDQFGIESVMAVNISAELEGTFGPVPPTLLFEYQTIAAVSQYLLTEHRQACIDRFGSAGAAAERPEPINAAPALPAAQRRPADGAAVETALQSYLKVLFGQHLQIDSAELGAAASFDTFGLESVMALQIVSRLEEDFGALPATLLFEFQTIATLAGYFLQEHGDVCRARFAGHRQPDPQGAGYGSQPTSAVRLTADQVDNRASFHGFERSAPETGRVDVRASVASLSDEEVETLVRRLTESA